MMLKLDNTDRLVDIEIGRFQSAGAITNDGLTHVSFVCDIVIAVAFIPVRRRPVLRRLQELLATIHIRHLCPPEAS